MNIQHAMQISGWMAEAELHWLSQHATDLDLVVEFGAWQGRSSVAMSSAKQLLCVDTWEGSEEHQADIAAGLDVWASWSKNLENYPNVTAHRMDLGDAEAVTALQELVAAKGGADMVFIDASHDYDSVRRDIQVAISLLKPDGLLCGHDYNGSWPGVLHAVNELVPCPQVYHWIWWRAPCM
jgi:predicted O-methyltransferase YrrM